MKTRIFNIEDFLVRIIPYLELSEIPKFARINKTSGALIHKLNTNGKFREVSGIMNSLFTSLQQGAKLILDEPLMDYNETSPDLINALRNINEGKINTQIVHVLRSQTLQYKTRPREKEVTQAAEKSAEIGLKALDRGCGNGRDCQGALICLLIFLVIAGLILLGDFIIRSIGSSYENYLGKKQKKKLEQRLKFFKDLPGFQKEQTQIAKIDCVPLPDCTIQTLSTSTASAPVAMAATEVNASTYILTAPPGGLRPGN